MTFDQAMAACRAGKSVRFSEMGPGWTIFHLNGHFYCRNPHNGSEYGYTPSRDDKDRDDWEIVG